MSMDRSRRIFLGSTAGAAAALALAPWRGKAETGRVFTPEAFGAKGDGVANDSLAFYRLAQAVNAVGGGTVSLRKTTYIVGQQVQGSDPRALYYFEAAALLYFKNCTRPLVVRGNGARIKCADGLRYGVFDMQGRPAHHPMPYLGPGVATPYQYMIRAERCSGGVEISDLELDGNLPRLVIGGEFGDTGRQIPASGINLVDNAGPELVRNVYSHHHPMDGLSIDGVDAPGRPVQRLIQNYHAEYNGRLGVALVGGRGYAFQNCKFNRSGRSTIQSNPGAGVDIEAEGGKRNRDYSFTDCEFIDNIGCGMVADSGDSEGATFTRCTFVGTTAWSAWPLKPRFRFDHCRFVGALVHPYGDKNPERAAQFNDCTFLDDPALTPNGKVYFGGAASGSIVEIADGVNQQFRRCTFRMTHNGLLPWSWYAIYEDCRFSQASTKVAYTKGRYLGTNVMNAPVDLYGSDIVGVLMFNGQRFERKNLGAKPW